VTSRKRQIEHLKKFGFKEEVLSKATNEQIEDLFRVVPKAKPKYELIDMDKIEE
jgi:hypothetical protein